MGREHAFGPASSKRLEGVDPLLQEVCIRALRLCPFDLTVVCGHRDEEAQTLAFRLGNSKVEYPHSKHNLSPSLAVDIAPWIRGAIPWKDERAFGVMAGCMFSGLALLTRSGAQWNLEAERSATYRLRWGGDWDQDGSTLDQTFMDLAHFELVT